MKKKTGGRPERPGKSAPAPARIHGRARAGTPRTPRERRPKRDPRDAKAPDTRLRLGEREYQLVRYPASADPTLRAWSAAEEHLLLLFGIGGPETSPAKADPDPLAEGETLPPLGQGESPILILGDPYGALATVLADRISVPVVRWTDSHLATMALSRNLVANGLELSTVEIVPSTADPAALEQKFDTVVLVVPKSLALLEYQVEWIKPCLAEGARVYAAGMTKHLSPHIGDILESRLGPTRVSRVYKKSVVFTVQVEDLEVDEDALTPSFYELDFGAPLQGEKVEGDPAGDFGGAASAGSGAADGARASTEPRDPSASVVRVFSFPGVFGAGRLDRGTELLVRSLPELSADLTVLDLGCGSGIIGLSLALQQPNLNLTLVDESHLAAASAHLTFEENGLRVPNIRVADGCEGIEPGSIDLVVSNPPFHAKHAMTVEEATRLFAPVRDVLGPEGIFYVVGAHGVDYGPTLRKMFAEVERVATDRRYSVHRCRKIPSERSTLRL